MANQRKVNIEDEPHIAGKQADAAWRAILNQPPPMAVGGLIAPFDPPRRIRIPAKKPAAFQVAEHNDDLNNVKVSVKFGLGHFNVDDAGQSKIVKTAFPTLKNEFVGFNPYVGIEIEAEHCHDGPAPLFAEFPWTHWGNKEENSLREGGREFVSAPLRGINIVGGLMLLDKWFKKAKIEPSFSHRTSTHIHINCRDLREDQIRYITLVYLAFENVIFNNFIEPLRQHNIYCVPLSDSLGDDQNFRLSRWFKYSALNLLPLSNFGTIEFRQLEGTFNIPRIKMWIKLINQIYAFGATKDKGEIDNYFNNLNTDSGYVAFGQDVFGKYWHHLNKGDLLTMMEDNLLLCKLLKDKELF